MKKIVIEEPKFETVQTGTDEKVYYETSDGQRFTNESEAEDHEFYNIKVKMRNASLPTDVTILDCESAGNLDRYIADYTYNVDQFNFEVKDLAFPNTYVLREHTIHGDSFGKDDDWYDYTTHLDIYLLEEWKEFIIKEVKELK